MPKSRKLPKIVRKRSKLHGFGVFAAEAITKNTRIIDYAGELIRNSRSGVREARYLAEGCIWVFRVNRTWSRDAGVDGNIARFINHACKPNCWFEVVDKTIWIRASRIDSRRRGADLRLPDGRGPHDPLPLPARVQDEALRTALSSWRLEGRAARPWLPPRAFGRAGRCRAGRA